MEDDNKVHLSRMRTSPQVRLTQKSATDSCSVKEGTSRLVWEYLYCQNFHREDIQVPHQRIYTRPSYNKRDAVLQDGWYGMLASSLLYGLNYWSETYSGL
jgi:hypothetical protein